MKRTGVVVLLVLATIVWTLAGIAVWAQRQALNTDNWVKTSATLLRNDQVRTALSSAILQRVYNRNAPKVLGSAAALTAWETANRQAHKTLLRLLNGDLAKNGTVTLNLHDLINQVAAGTGLPAGVADRLPANLQQIQILKSDQLKGAQDAVQALKTLTIVLIVLAVLLFAGAIALAADRRRTLVVCGGCLIFSGVLILAVRRLGADYAVNALANTANAGPAVKATLKIGTSLLADVAWGTILFGLFLITGGWFLGSGARAAALRRRTAPALRDHAMLLRAGLGFLILLLVIWGPVPWTRHFWTILVFTIAAFIWLERLRHVALQEVAAGEPLPDPIAPAVGQEADGTQREGHPV